jgi:hypothetical protein
VLKKIFEPKETTYTDNCIITNYIVFLSIRHWGMQTSGRQKIIHNFNKKSDAKTPLGDLNATTILKEISGK